MLPVSTPAGDFRVWTKRFGNNPDLRVLLLHGGPGATHEYLESVDGYLPAAGVEYYLYDQLGSHYSDQPDDPSLWQVERFVDEVEQVRVALGLGPESFVLYGQSWGGILAIEYALAHPQHLKGLVISNMMASIPAYNRYAEEVLMPGMDQGALAEIKRLEAAGGTEGPEYEQLLKEHHDVVHVCRLPADEWPEPVTRAFGHTNRSIYVPMQGPSELGASGTLGDWDRTADLHRITAPTLITVGRYDELTPACSETIRQGIAGSRVELFERSAHVAHLEEGEGYAEVVERFLREVEGRP